MKFSIYDLFSSVNKFAVSCRFAWSNLLKELFVENLIFCAVIDLRRKLEHSFEVKTTKKRREKLLKVDHIPANINLFKHQNNM